MPAQQEELIESWIKKLDLTDPPPQVIKALTVRIESICLLRKEQSQLVGVLSELTKVPAKRIYVWLKTFDNCWTADLDEVDLFNRLSILRTEIEQLEIDGVESIAGIEASRI